MNGLRFDGSGEGRSMHGHQGSGRMGRRSRWSLLVVVGCWLVARPAGAQQQPPPGLPSPRLLVVMPAGGRVGTTIEVTVTGQDLDDPQGLLFSHPGFRAERVEEASPPPNPRTPAMKRATAPPTIARFRITIAADVPLGLHDVRLVNAWGVSNPRAFVVGDLDEVGEAEPNNDVDQAQRVALNTAVDGTIAAPTDVDYVVFAGRKGQRVIVSALASSIDSRLLPLLQLYDGAGRLRAADHEYRYTDALLDCTLPADGDYHVRLSEFTYSQGSGEHFYRLSVSTAPWIDAVFPPMVEPGQSATLTVFGRNLPGGRPDPEAIVDGRVLERASATIDVPGAAGALERLAYGGRVSPVASGLDGFEYVVRNETGASNPVLLTYATAPVVHDGGANDTAEAAQEVAPPCEIAGRIEARRDRDVYAFTARKGDVFSIEAFGERLGAPVDLYLVLRDAAGKVLGELDENPEVLGPVQFPTRTDDPARLRCVAPADGRYVLMVSCRLAPLLAGPRQIYRLRIAPERPDFRLVVMPTAIGGPGAWVVGRGGQMDATVFLWRLDGFGGEVTLTAEGLPPGVSSWPQVVGPGLKQGTLVVQAAPDAPAWTGPIRVRGTATVDGRSVVREARAATITWPVPQPNVPAISRLDRELVLAVRDPPPFRLGVGREEATVVQGERLTVPLELTRLWPDLKAPVQVTAINFPPNLTASPIVMAAGKDAADAILEVKANVVPGVYSLVLRGQTQVAFGKDPAAKPKPNLTVTQPATPIRLTVLPKQVATVTVSPKDPKAAVGRETEVVVKVARLYDYAGEFQVELIPPQGTRGLSSLPVTIPVGRDEAKLVLRVAPGAPTGTRGDFLVRATALVGGKVPTVHEAKLSVTVIK
jgi:hypothetical protein